MKSFHPGECSQGRWQVEEEEEEDALKRWPREEEGEELEHSRIMVRMREKDVLGRSHEVQT